MTKLRANLIANLLGSVWAALMSFAFIPVYLHFLGMEAYGLIGFFVGLQGILAMLDFGFSNTLNRELAQLSALEDRSVRMRNVTKTLEIVYCAVGLLTGLLIFMLAESIATSWLNVRGLPHETTADTIRLMGLVTALQWPVALYSGGLMGLQRQITLNVISNILVATLRGVGACVVLWLLSATIQAFFVWQAIISFLHVALTRHAIWDALPSVPERATFHPEILKEISGFTLKMSGLMMATFLFLQIDKLLLSRILDLESFGRYALAAAIATVFYRMATPVWAAFFPRFSQLHVKGKRDEIGRLLHISTQGLALILLPAAVWLAIFSSQLLTLWMRNPSHVQGTDGILSMMLSGTVIISLMTLPHSVMMATGWIRTPFLGLVAATVLLSLAIIIFVPRFGGLASAVAWSLVNIGYALILMRTFSERYLNPGELRGWVFCDIGLPLLAICLVLVPARLLIKGVTESTDLLVIFLSFPACFMSALLATPQIRNRLVALIAGYFGPNRRIS